MTTVLRTCGRCKRTHPTGHACRCSKPKQRLSESLRREQQPWTRLYSTAAYAKGRKEALRLAQHQCTAIIDGRRCSITEHLHAHHTRKLRTLYANSRSWNAFVAEASDPHGLAILCKIHHPTVEAASTPQKYLQQRCDGCYAIVTALPCKNCERITTNATDRRTAQERRQQYAQQRAAQAEAKQDEMRVKANAILEMRKGGTKWKDIVTALHLKSPGHAHNILTTHHPEYGTR